MLVSEKGPEPELHLRVMRFLNFDLKMLQSTRSYQKRRSKVQVGILETEGKKML
jgi:hypothetical protein